MRFQPFIVITIVLVMIVSGWRVFTPMFGAMVKSKSPVISLYYWEYYKQQAEAVCTLAATAGHNIICKEYDPNERINSKVEYKEARARGPLIFYGLDSCLQCMNETELRSLILRDPQASHLIKLQLDKYLVFRYSVPAVFYNKALLSALGIKTPQPDQTWDDLVTILEQTAVKTPRQTAERRLELDSDDPLIELFQLSMVLQIAGLEVPGLSNVDWLRTPAFRTALTLAKRLATAIHLVTLDDPLWLRNPDTFKTGKSMILWASLSAVSQFDSQLDWYVIPVPIGQSGERKPPLVWDHLWCMGGDVALDVGWSFLKWLIYDMDVRHVYFDPLAITVPVLLGEDQDLPSELVARGVENVLKTSASQEPKPLTDPFWWRDSGAQEILTSYLLGDILLDDALTHIEERLNIYRLKKR